MSSTFVPPDSVTWPYITHYEDYGLPRLSSADAVYNSQPAQQSSSMLPGAIMNDAFPSVRNPDTHLLHSWDPSFSPQYTHTSSLEYLQSNRRLGHSGYSGHILPHPTRLPLDVADAPCMDRLAMPPYPKSGSHQHGYPSHTHFVRNEPAEASYNTFHATPTRNQCGSRAVPSFDFQELNYDVAMMRQRSPTVSGMPSRGGTKPDTPQSHWDPRFFMIQSSHQTLASTSSTPASTSTQPASPVSNHPTFTCLVDGCELHICVDLSTLKKHLNAFHGYPSPKRGHALDCLWAGCVCRLTTCKDRKPGQHSVHVEDMAKHIWEHHLNFQDPCPKCGEVGWVPGFSKNRHEKKCAGRKPARCRTCCVLFDSEAALAGHLALDRCPGPAEMNMLP